MAYKVIILYQLYMPSYFLGTFTEYPNLGLIHINKKPDVKSGFRSCPTKIRTWTNRTRICCAAITPLDSILTAQNYVFFCLLPNKSEKNSAERLAF